MSYVKPRYGAGSSWYSIRVSREAFYTLQQRAEGYGTTVRELINQWLGITKETPIEVPVVRAPKRVRDWSQRRPCIRCGHTRAHHVSEDIGVGLPCTTTGCLCPGFRGRDGKPAHLNKATQLQKGPYERLDRGGPESVTEG